jgi:alpha-D-ribose 1-methylphosphonate 5-triphosphate synthase subunit PhnH
MNYPPYTTAEAQTRETFLALMWALSYPGRIQQLPDSDNSFLLIGDTLLDIETSFYTPRDDWKTPLGRNGAKALPPESAAYHFYPVLDDTALKTIEQAAIGTMLYPDIAATLIIGCTLGQGMDVAFLQGPGINGQQSFSVDGLPAAFWTLRESAARFPLGWDVFFVDGRQVIGLPRSSQVSR